ncbi:MAG: S-methyl-5-thioribose-1-phosphate isomerase, partial [Acidobacteria bacterium]|nr:S-methyl-5-thioribose-1-phosphate isomerase [Acidobacteriota bacterium]
RTVRMIDQLALPFRFEIFDSPDHASTARAIRDMVVRGAGAIGAAGAYGMGQAALEAPSAPDELAAYVRRAAALVKGTRPTAQNLFSAVDRVLARTLAALPQVAKAREAAVEEALAIASEDAEAGRRIGEIGAVLIKDGARVLTHCNAGWLAFTDWGTALAPLYRAKRDGKRVFVWVDETRPRLQGARLTAWELAGEGIDFRIIPDNAAGWFMRRGEVDLVIVGADRIAANGDTANKIGTYEKAVLARESGIPFYVAAPTSTIDFDCPDGDAIPIEERSEDEVLTASGPEVLEGEGASSDASAGAIRTVRVAAPGSHARNPAFDVTPAGLIAGIITDRGLCKPSELRERYFANSPAISFL